MKVLGEGLPVPWYILFIPVGIILMGFMTNFDEWAGFPALLVTGAHVLSSWLFFLMFTEKKLGSQPHG